MTDHMFRVLLVVPVARRAGAATWVRNNLDLLGTDWLGGAGLSATGQLPATHFWCAASFHLANLRKLFALARSILDTIDVPVGWDNMTLAEKKTAFQQAMNALETRNVHVLIYRGDIDAWPDPLAWALVKGLRPIHLSPGP